MLCSAFIYGHHFLLDMFIPKRALLWRHLMNSPFDIQGKGGHGGLPHQTIDSIYVASQLVVNLQSIVSRQVDPIEPCVVSVGSFHGGTSFNVIAETSVLNGTVARLMRNLDKM